jgi:Niemann-Pick C1 protein
MQQVEALIGSCPACRNNFHDFFCSFTCSPRQADFLNVTATQTTSEGKTGVKSIDFHVSPTYGTGFYDSCKGVQAGSTFAMDLIGGGAKDYSGFFRFLGQEKNDGLGSPFRIDFPASAPEGLGQLDQRARNCADDDLANRCTCVDCPQVCTALPPVAPPGTEATCHIGRMSCLTFTLTVGYALALAGFLLGFFALRAYRARREQSLRRLAPSASSDTPLETPLSPRAPTLIGASSLALGHDGVDSLGTLSERQLGRGAALLDPTEAAQPRQYRLNTLLRRGFYRLGLGAAGAPWRTFALVFAATALLNAGWARFQIETDPVRLWVSPSSDSKLRKDFFDDNFGPFFRTQQIFITAEPSRWTYQGETDLVSATATQEPVLSYERLKFWFEVEADIRALTSPNGDQLTDLCYKPLGEEGACVVQSVTQWYGNDFAEVDPDTWQEHLVACASEPVNCLPEFLQPLQPKFVLGGYPRNADDKPDYLDAKAMVATYVVANSNNKTELARIESWEVVLREYLQGLQERASAEAGLHIAFRTEIAIEEELNKSTNMDIRTVVLSYIAMFFYVALTLGSGGARGGESLVGSLVRWARNFPRLFQRRSVATASFTDDPLDQPTWLPRIPRRLFVDSKFLLGLFGIALVVLSVSSSVGFFSALGVKVTLIIAEVIPFLVLAVGVDNVFILVNELDRQNLLHGPGAGASATMPGGLASPPARGASLDDGAEVQSMRTALSPEERVARALAKMGPSILLSTVTETLAFALGALVPMPAVRNFALYAAGSVLLNAFLQCTVFVAALALDLRRVEAGRVDCLPCLRVQSRIALLDAPARGGMGRMARFIRRRYAPWLLSPVVKTCVLAFFGGLFIASVISIQHIELGLGTFNHCMCTSHIHIARRPTAGAAP